MFGVWDYVVLVLVLLISSSIGVYYRFTGGKQKTMQVCYLFLFDWYNWT
jgi:sodium-coupled monocarboxylate transporter 8/12